MQLKTERLNLAEISFNDLEKIHQLHSLPETDKYNTLGIPETIKDTENLLQGWLLLQKATPKQSYIFCITKMETNEFVGLIAINLGKANYKNAEVWYKLHPDFWGLGFASEALNEVVKFGFRKLNLHRIEAGCAVENITSIKVLEKAGFIREGRKREVLPLKNNWSDNFFYAILDADFEANN